MRLECFPPRGLTLALVLAGFVAAAPARAQDPAGEPVATPPPVRFEPRFIDAGTYRDDQVLLYDWPALTRLVRWSARVAQTVAEPDSTLAPDLIQEFRQRVVALAEEDPPAFLGTGRDSVRMVLSAVEARLERAEAMLAESLPARIARPTGQDRPNAPDRDRTYATGPTAVRVPAGVGVGEADSLPGAELAGSAGGENYLELVAAALDELDALVHLVRKAGPTTSEAPGPEAPTPTPDRAPPRPAP
ncbi:MAG TPA: hypothetical protein VMR66_06280 [Gemmatimonadota bacterium]|nr:hypothetical protein [Gemmatimonadota bacterium]